MTLPETTCNSTDTVSKAVKKNRYKQKENKKLLSIPKLCNKVYFPGIRNILNIVKKVRAATLSTH